jgi:hypothetical protein
MKGYRSIISLCVALGMLIYAIPRLQIGQGWTYSTVFSVVWIGMALLIIASHLHDLLGVDEETREELVRIKRMKRWQFEQKLTGRS